MMQLLVLSVLLLVIINLVTTIKMFELVEKLYKDLYLEDYDEDEDELIEVDTKSAPLPDDPDPIFPPPIKRP